MSYSEPLINQPRVLLLSVGVGALLCIFYVLIQGVMRLSGEGRLSYFIADGLFCAVFALVSFFFMVLYNNGRVRLHLILGEAAGFFILYFSAGKYFYALVVGIVNFLRRIAVVLTKPAVRLFLLVAKKIRIFGNVIKAGIASRIKKYRPEGDSFKKKKKKFDLFDKIHLKNPNKSV